MKKLIIIFVVVPIGVMSLAVLTVFSLYYFQRGAPLDLRNLQLGDRSYDLVRGLGTYELKRAYAQPVNREGKMVSYYLVIGPKFNKCSREPLRIWLRWSGDSPTTQPEGFTEYTLTNLERSVFYTINSSSHSLSTSKLKFLDLVGQISTKHDNLYNGVTSVELRKIIGEVGEGREFVENTLILVKYRRVISLVDIAERNNKKIVSVEYQSADADYIVEFTMNVKASDLAGIRCVLETAADIGSAVGRSELDNRG